MINEWWIGRNVNGIGLDLFASRDFGHPPPPKKKQRKTTENVNQASQCPDWDSSWAHPEYMSDALLTASWKGTKPNPRSRDYFETCLCFRAVRDKMTAFNSCFHHGYLWERHFSYCGGGGGTGDLSLQEGRYIYIPVSFRRRGIPDLVVMETRVVVTNEKTGIAEKGGNRLTIV
jgi:hypothetical protein